MDTLTLGLEPDDDTWESLGTYWDGTDDHDYEDPWSVKPYRIQDITLFTNLTALRLPNIYGDLTQWRSVIVSALKASPCLEELALSIDATTVKRYFYAGFRKSCSLFLQRLCDAYAAAAGCRCGCAP